MTSPARRAYERFWLDFTLAPEVLRLFRLAFFAILALDMWLEMAHAPRYGAGDFNVSHLPALDGVLPVLGRPAAAALFAAGAYLAALIALGGAHRVLLGVLTAIFGVFYFSSQLDSYQHHYLVFLLLLVLCFVDWRPGPGRGGGWPLRLVLVQLSIVYFYAAMSKLDDDWRSGQVLATQVSEDWARAFIERMGGFGRAAVLVVATELFLAVAIQLRALRPYAAAIGIPFHAFIELSGFHIGLFSFFMFALYLMMLPQRPLVWLVTWWDRVSAPVLARSIPLAPAAVAALAGALVLITLPVGAAAATAVALAAGGWSIWRAPADRRARVAAAHVAACVGVALIARPALTEAARDYYRYWGGSSRRLGDLPQAVAAYERVVELDPDFAQGHTSLANLYRRTGKLDDALREAMRAQSLAPDDYRPLLVQALVHESAGRTDEAVKAAERVLAMRPGDPDATRIVQRRPAPAGAGGEE